MKNLVDKLKEGSGGLFKSQDSKYFIKTAFKVTFVPLVSFTIIFYSLWNVLEMNYSFFVANGFAEGAQFKEAFIDKVLLNINEYFVYFGIIVTGVFMGGLFISHLALRPFEEIEGFCEDVAEDPDLEFSFNKLNAKKLIYQGAYAFFEYLRSVRLGEKVDGEKILPKAITQMKRPKVDKVFLLQYLAIIGIIILITNIVFYTFTNELYQEIVAAGISLLKGDQVIAKFMQSQESILFNIYTVAMSLNAILYLSLSKNIIRSVDGVAYAFCRDFAEIVEGNHNKRIFPRFTDPGKEAANACNHYIDFVMEEADDGDEIDIEEDTVDSSDMIDEQESEQNDNLVLFNKDEKHIPESDHLEIERTPSIETLASSSQSQPQLRPQSQEVHVPEQAQEELPPSFIGQAHSEEGEKVFNITTPKGYKVENLDEHQILKILTELEKQK